MKNKLPMLPMYPTLQTNVTLTFSIFLSIMTYFKKFIFYWIYQLCRLLNGFVSFSGSDPKLENVLLHDGHRKCSPQIIMIHCRILLSTPCLFLFNSLRGSWWNGHRQRQCRCLHKCRLRTKSNLLPQISYNCFVAIITIQLMILFV